MAKSKQTTYAVEWEVLGRAPSPGESLAVCQALLEVVRPRLRRAIVDAFTDHQENELGAEALAVQQRLLARGSKGMAVRLDLADDSDWRALYLFGAHSINAELLDAKGRFFGCLHDNGDSVWAELTDAEAKEWRVRIEGTAPLVPLSEIHERRRLERRTIKAQKLEARRAKRSALIGRWFGRN